MINTSDYKDTYRFWWLKLIVGVISVIFGFWIFSNPVESYVGLSLYFSIILVVIGIVESINAISAVRQPGWGWNFTMGLVNIGLGIILLSHPFITAEILPYIVSFMLMFLGIDFIGQSTMMKAVGMRNWGWVLTGGILTLLLAFMIIFHPVLGMLNIVIWTGLSFIFGGISAIIFSLMLRK